MRFVIFLFEAVDVASQRHAGRSPRSPSGSAIGSLGSGRRHSSRTPTSPHEKGENPLRVRGFRLCGQALLDASSRVNERSVVDCRRGGGVVLARGGDEIELVLPQRFVLDRVDAALSSDDLVGAAAVPQRPNQFHQYWIARGFVQDGQQGFVMI